MSTPDGALPTIQMLWIEGRLSRLERLSLASFAACGHPVDLYTYGLDRDPPAGIKVRDASEIVPANKRFRYQGGLGHGSWATFSNLFRFTLLYERGGIWCDTDMVCLKPLLFARDMPMFFSSELAISNVGGTNKAVPQTNSGAMKVPSQSILISRCLDKYHNLDFANMRWGEAGPGIVRQAVEEHQATKYILHPDIFCSVPHWETLTLLFGARAISPNAYAIHFWNEVLRWNFVDKDDKFDRHSIYERLASHYLPNDTNT